MNKKDVSRYFSLKIRMASNILKNEYLTDESKAEARGYVKALEDTKEDLLKNGGKYIPSNQGVK